MRAMPLLALVVIVAGCTDDGTIHDAGVDAGDSTVRDSSLADSSADTGPVDAAGACDLPVFDRSCATVDDCTNAVHQADCCGTQNPLGIALSERARFDAFESACVATYPGCGCPAMYPTADDGSTTTSMQSAAEATLQCAAGVCTTTYGP